MVFRAYLEFGKKSFMNNLVYRLDFFVGILNTMVMIFVNIAIWKAIYEEEQVMGGIQFRVLTTYIILAFLMQCIYTMEEYILESKVRTGLITSDLIKPINFRLYLFSYNLGTLAFRILFQLFPMFLLSIVLFKVLPPFSLTMTLYFFTSAALGYLVLYNLNFLAWVSSFWFFWTFSLITIKDAAVMILSGALLPLWFMPPWMVQFIKYTPFDSIYYTPISIYLGQMPENEIATCILRQIIWVIILFGIGHLLWKIATRRLVVQGG